METTDRDRLLDYLPLLAYMGFWLQGALIPALLIGELKLILLGFITAPALAALGIAGYKIGKRN
jgi:hypothetical protein